MAMMKKTDTRYSIGDVVLIRNEARKKFHATYFGPFKILETNWLGTYVLATIDGEQVLRKLVHGSRLVQYWPSNASENLQTAMTSSWNEIAAEHNETILQPSLEILEVLNEQEEVPRTYHELSLMSKASWKALYRSGDRMIQVGEEEATKAIIAARQRRARTQENRAIISSARSEAKEASKLAKKQAIDIKKAISKTASETRKANRTQQIAEILQAKEEKVQHKAKNRALALAEKTKRLDPATHQRSDIIGAITPDVEVAERRILRKKTRPVSKGVVSPLLGAQKAPRRLSNTNRGKTTRIRNPDRQETTIQDEVPRQRTETTYSLRAKPRKKKIQ
jgi:hypothetical protein